MRGDCGLGSGIAWKEGRGSGRWGLWKMRVMKDEGYERWGLWKMGLMKDGVDGRWG